MPEVPHTEEAARGPASRAPVGMREGAERLLRESATVRGLAEGVEVARFRREARR